MKSTDDIANSVKAHFLELILICKFTTIHQTKVIPPFTRFFQKFTENFRNTEYILHFNQVRSYYLKCRKCRAKKLPLLQKVAQVWTTYATFFSRDVLLYIFKLLLMCLTFSRFYFSTQHFWGMNVRFKTNLEVTANFFQLLSKNFSLKIMLELSSVA